MLSQRRAARSLPGTVLAGFEHTDAAGAAVSGTIAAGILPPGVLNVVNGFGVDSAGSFLTAHPQVNGITFTDTYPANLVNTAAAATGWGVLTALPAIAAPVTSSTPKV